MASCEVLPFPQRPVIILGAGIIGCAAARQLLLNGFSVILVAEFQPGDQDIFYASAWAGAAWHAAGGIPPDQRYLQARTHRHLRKMADDPDSGVCIVHGREYLEQPLGPDSSIWGRRVLSHVSVLRIPPNTPTLKRKQFRELRPGEYPPEFCAAWSYDAIVTDPTLHMPYLGREIRALGGRFIRKRVESLQELFVMFPQSSIFINASGLGSRHLADVQDKACYPDRGQNVFYRTDLTGTMFFRNGQEYTYIIPRPLSQGLVLGGVKQRDNVSPEPDPEIARDEIARAHRLAPHVVPEHPPEESLSHIVGIRPGRDGGFRLDSQRIGSRTVLSAYGFGGGGYAFSYGVAEALFEMVEEVENQGVVGDDCVK
ncbi:FAD dependent oxidoreductase superfamily [Aspergillus ambiguus]|uniref:FAD-dependent oxidoreductase n=1 Tax=Aspergillus ambiguus TaxID=176160 RepID=UPI003CCD376D